MSHANHSVLRVLASSSILMALGACAPQSRLLREPLPGPELTASVAIIDHGLGATLERVIVRGSAGSWVRGANWDEYVLSFANNSDAPLRITAMALDSEYLDPVAPVGDLTQLERQTSAQLRALQSVGVTVATGYAAGALAFASVGSASGELGVVAGASAAAIMIPIGLIAGGIYVHSKHKRQRMDRELIQIEIRRRAVVFPLDLPPRGERHGSVFFPVTPAPQRLSIHYISGDFVGDVGIDLAGLAGLHIRPQKPR